MPKIRSAQIEEIHHNQQQRKPKMGPSPQMQKPEDQQVMQDEMGSDVCGRSNMHGVRAVEGVRVSELQDIQDDPVDGCDDAVHGEGGVVSGVLAPDCAARLVAFVGGVEGVDYAGDYEEEPGDGCSDLVGQERVARVLIAAGEGVVCRGCLLNNLFFLGDWRKCWGRREKRDEAGVPAN